MRIKHFQIPTSTLWFYGCNFISQWALKCFGHSWPSSRWWKQEFKNLLTPWRRVLFEKLTGLQLVKKFPAFHGTRRFITALTSVRNLSLSWASPIQSIYPHPTSWRSILISSAHLRLGLPSGLLPSGFPRKTLQLEIVNFWYFMYLPILLFNREF